jgi:hypothetical protein
MLSQQTADRLTCFMFCIREAASYFKLLPKEILQQLNDAIGTPDLVLATAIAIAVPRTQRDEMRPLFAALTSTETLAIFFRKGYAGDIAKLGNKNQIYRDNSVVMAATGQLLRAHRHDIVEEILQLFSANANLTAREMFMKWLPVLEKLSQTARIVLRIAFISARRKYTDGNTAVQAIGSLLMLRFVMASLGSQEEMVGLLSKVLNIALLKGDGKGVRCDDELFKTVSHFLLGLTQLKTNSVPKDSYKVSDLLALIMRFLDEIIVEIRATKPSDVHPMVYSVHEMIETFFTGPQDDPRQRVNDYLGDQ